MDELPLGIRSCESDGIELGEDLLSEWQVVELEGQTVKLIIGEGLALTAEAGRVLALPEQTG